MGPEIHPFSFLRDSGLLWLFNTSVMHPRGYALALCMDGDEATGFQILGDGSEPWAFGDDTDKEFQTVINTLPVKTKGDE